MQGYKDTRIQGPKKYVEIQLYRDNIRVARIQLDTRILGYRAKWICRDKGIQRK